MARRRKICMSVAQFEKLVKKKSCSCGPKRGRRRRGRKRMPPRVKHGKHKGQFRKRR